MKKISYIGTNVIEFLYGVVTCIAYPYIKLFISYRWNYERFTALSLLFLITTTILLSIFSKFKTKNALHKIVISASVKYFIGFIGAMVLLYIISLIRNIPGIYFYYVCPLPFFIYTNSVAWIWSGIKLILLGLFLLWSAVIVSQAINRITTKH